MSYVNQVGTIFVQKKVTSSTLTTSDANVFQVTGNGLIIDTVTVTTDTTGLAGGTNFQLKADGILFFSTAVSGLGASSVKDIKNASVTGSTVVVPAGTKYITVSNTAAVGTGSGVATITLGCRKLDSNSTIEAI